MKIEIYKDLKKTDIFMLEETEITSINIIEVIFNDIDVDLTMFHHNISKQKNLYGLVLNINSLNFKEIPFKEEFCDKIKKLTIETNNDFDLCLDKFKNLEKFSMFSDESTFWSYKFEDLFFKKIKNINLKNISITVNLYEKLKNNVYFNYQFFSYRIFTDSYTEKGFTTYKIENENSIEDDFLITPIDYEEFEDIIYRFLL